MTEPQEKPPVSAPTPPVPPAPGQFGSITEETEWLNRQSTLPRVPMPQELAGEASPERDIPQTPEKNTVATGPESERQDDRSALEAITEYRERLKPWLERLIRNDKMMNLMRRLSPRGFTDARLSKAYTRRRKGLTRSYRSASALHVRIGRYADGLDGVSADVRRQAKEVKSAQEPTYFRMEDFFRKALTESDRWTGAHRTPKFGNRMGREGGDYGPYEEERKLAPEFYDERVRNLQKRVEAIEEEVGRHEERAKIPDVLTRLDEIYSELDELDDRIETGAAPHDSDEQRALLWMIDALGKQLEDAIPESELPELEIEPTPEERYDAALKPMIAEVGQWENVIATLEKAGKLTPEVITDLQEELRKYPAQMLELDAKLEDEEGSDAPGKSKSRAQLKALLEGIRERLLKKSAESDRLMQELHIDEEQPQEMPPTGTEEKGLTPVEPTAKPVSVGDLRAMHARIRASYADVQHRLTIDQRREMRGRLAHFSSLIRRAELENAVSHATEHAPAIAHVTLASVPRRLTVRTAPEAAAPAPGSTSAARGIWGALGDAFRLK